ncbi:ribose-phosphate pyrophosphokinase [Paenibacillus alvei]|uniref:ribose-phosphate pyrophosphokinase n=1 Tax=Paenibacillus alvei TaxID=44250 RepID=UPI00227DDB8E|nr:ribose-phosphate pyrophosphokinase [Paenibacillus alvei]MCY9737482.1 ribose-phosphate pyrophosphokinase [Paenibacillus alvei]
MIQLNGVTLGFETFPNGEIKLPSDEIHYFLIKSRNVVNFKYENDSDLIKLLFLKKYLDSQSAISHLTIMYMPYSRMDRVEENSAFTLKYVADFINSLNFENVKVLEPHSDVTTALLNNSFAIYPTVDLFDSVYGAVNFNKDTDFVFYPDAGAQKRYASKLKGLKHLVGFKDRDFQTGKINGLTVVGEGVSQDSKIIIIDDLCSYGGTFKASAEKLRSLGAKEIYLLVAHCEDSIHEGGLLDSGLIDKVFTTDSLLTNYNHERLQVFSCF